MITKSRHDQSKYMFAEQDRAVCISKEGPAQGENLLEQCSRFVVSSSVSEGDAEFSHG